MAKKVPTNTWVMVCDTCSIRIPWAKRSDAFAHLDSHNKISHKGKRVARVEEIIV
jgi:hypothetical protein